MLYIDTSVIIAFLTDEGEAPKVEAWFEKQGSSAFAVSDWTLTEIFSALSLKYRTGQISAEKHQAALLESSLLLDKSLRLFPIKRAHFNIAATYCNHRQTGLRSGAALHLAAATELNAEIVTLDKRFATAANTLGARCTLL
ncbi:type II toxin-antitoxin system VapC family toxin [Neorhizobium sp. NPDC001467]|uniref:type II toxin-antitoxin system VapC family toxin n=1 Tax=Neorhizobium sp. NPDC001467 TaxID=3390595 RepID=UPI003D0321B3